LSQIDESCPYTSFLTIKGKRGMGEGERRRESGEGMGKGDERISRGGELGRETEGGREKRIEGEEEEKRGGEERESEGKKEREMEETQRAGDFLQGVADLHQSEFF
jgi:hypothetical protein